MNHETAMIEMQMWAFEQRALYIASCLILFGFIWILFWRSKK